MGSLRKRAQKPYRASRSPLLSEIKVLPRVVGCASPAGLTFTLTTSSGTFKVDYCAQCGAYHEMVDGVPCQADARFFVSGDERDGAAGTYSPEGDDVRGTSGQLLGWTVPHEPTRIHAAPCASCPSAHYAPDPEALDYRAAPRRVQLASLFPCAWRPEALCKGYCDFLGVTPEDVSDGQVEAARRELARNGGSRG